MLDMVSMSAHQDVTEAELAVLDALWNRGASTIRELTDDIYPSGGSSEYATVHRLLERMEKKGWVERERGSRGSPQVFRPRRTRESLIDHRLRRTAEQLCGGSFSSLLSCLVSGERLSKEERQRLRQLIDDLDQRSGAGDEVGP